MGVRTGVDHKVVAHVGLNLRVGKTQRAAAAVANVLGGSGKGMGGDETCAMGAMHGKDCGG